MNDRLKNALYIVVTSYFRAVLVALVVMVVAAGYFLLLGPRFKEISQQGILGYDAKRAQLEERQRYLDDLEVMVSRYEQVDFASLEKLSLVLPHKQDIPGILVEFQALAESVGLTVQSITVTELGAAAVSVAPGSAETRTGSTAIPAADAATLSSAVKPLNVSLTVAGADGYGTLKALLTAIERDLRIFDVSSVSFTPDGATYTLLLKTYYAL